MEEQEKDRFDYANFEPQQSAELAPEPPAES